MAVGQIKPTPEINIVFKTLATTAIQRSAQGILCLIVKDTKQKNKWTILKGFSDLEADKWEDKTVKLITLAYQKYAPKKVMIRTLQTEETDYAVVLKELEKRKINWLACPNAQEEDDTKVVTWVKEQFGTEKINKTIKYVSSFANETDHVAIVEFGNTGTIKSKLGEFTPQEYTVGIAGAIAGCPINRSLDNEILGDLIEVDDIEPALGKFTLYNDEDCVRVNYAVNSKTSFDSIWKKDTRKIKVVEGMCQVVDDIRDTFKNYWLGKYINNYDNKQNFCSNVTKVYFKDLTPNILSADYDNKIEIDLDAQRKQAITDGIDVENMTELEILQYSTGDDVFLTGDVRFADTMSNLFLSILM